MRSARAARAVAQRFMAETRRMVMWLILAALAAAVSYVGFRGYFSAELLLNFANAYYC